jgi:hypothetical protein
MLKFYSELNLDYTSFFLESFYTMLVLNTMLYTVPATDKFRE